MLEVHEMHAYYGPSHIVQGISLSVGAGEGVALMGRNGVGKTTSLKSIMGMETRVQGKIVFCGKDVTAQAAHTRAANGLGYVPEERAVFAQMSVEENIRIGAMIHRAKDVKECLATAYSLFPILEERRLQLAGTLSGGQQKMLGLARALALRPKVLMVDEPSEGLMPANVELIGLALEKAVKSGVALLLVDASFDVVKESCTRLYAMDRGLITGTYHPQEFSSPDQLAATFLGGSNE